MRWRKKKGISERYYSELLNGSEQKKEDEVKALEERVRATVERKDNQIKELKGLVGSKDNQLKEFQKLLARQREELLGGVGVGSGSGMAVGGN